MKRAALAIALLAGCGADPIDVEPAIVQAERAICVEPDRCTTEKRALCADGTDPNAVTCRYTLPDGQSVSVTYPGDPCG